MEARGEIRGGRFVDGFSGEQFALADAVTSMRNFRHQDPAQLVVVAATDPLNLTGIITPGERIPAQLGYRILFRDGIPAATMRGHEIRFYVKYDTATEQGIRTALLTHSLPRHTRAIGT
jgi:ATP-dependent Lhr-like helicase